MAGRRLLGANGKFITTNNKKASVAAVVASNNENLFKLIASEKSHISQVNSATPDFNTVMKNYGTFSDKTWKATVAAEKARVDAFTSLNDNPSESMQTDWDPETKLKREILASQAVEKQQNISADNLRQTLSGTGEEFNFTKQGEFQPKPVFEEKPTHVYHSNATQTGVDGVLRDAIGREMNQTWTNVGQESYVGQNTDELAFEAIEAIKNEEKAVTTEKIEYIDPHKYNRDGKGQIITNTPAHNQLHSEKTAAVVDDSISGNNQKVYAETLKLEKDTKDSALQAKQLGDSTELNADKVIIDPEQAIGLWTVPNDEGIESNIATEVAIKSMDEVSTQLQADLKVQVEQENLSATATSLAQESLSDQAKKDSIRLEAKAKREEAVFAHNKFQNDRIDKIAKESDKAAELAAYKASQGTIDKNAKVGLVTIPNDENLEATASDLAIRTSDEVSARLRADLDAQIEEEGLDATATDLAKESLSDQAKRELAEEKAKKQREAQGEEIQRSLDDEQSTNERIAKEKADAFRKKMDDAHKSYRPRTGPVEKSKTPEKYATHGDKRGTPDLLTGKDPFRFSTLAYPMNITTDPEYGHYMLFYVNVQNKTGYKYAGI